MTWGANARGPTFSSHVRVESRYGTNLFLDLPEAWSARAEMTRPSVVSDLWEERTVINWHLTPWTMSTSIMICDHSRVRGE